jgi:hypothetical protein
MHRKTRRPAHCQPGSMTDARELGKRLRCSRERLTESELAKSARAWRMWAACVDATFGYAREGDLTYAATLGNTVGVDRWAASKLLQQFNELGVFVWIPAPRGSRGISELRLPQLEIRSANHVNRDETHQSRDPRASLQSNTSEVLRHSSVESLDGKSKDGESESPRASAGQLGEREAEAGTLRSGTPQAGPLPDEFQSMLAGLSLEELRHGVEAYGPIIAARYRDELEKRAREANPMRAEIERLFGDA